MQHLFQSWNEVVKPMPNHFQLRDDFNGQSVQLSDVSEQIPNIRNI
jgi:hypothetical protein